MTYVTKVSLLTVALCGTPAIVRSGEAVAKPTPATEQVHYDRLGDALPSGASGRLGTMRLRQIEGVCAVALSPDGKRLAAASGERTRRVLGIEKQFPLCIWDVASGKKVHHVYGHSSDIHSVAYAPDGRILATGSADRTVCLWDAASGEVLHRWRVDWGKVGTLTFTPDGKRLIAGSEDKAIRIWDVGTRKLLAKLDEKHEVRSLACAPDGNTLAALSGKTISHWNLTTKKLLRQWESDQGRGNIVAFSPDGKALAVGSGEHEGSLHLWTVSTGTLARCVEKKTAVDGVAFSPDGNKLAAVGRGSAIRIWDLATGKIHRRLETHAGDVHAVVYSADGKTLASGSSSGTLGLWDAVTGKDRLPWPGHRQPIHALSYSRDGRMLASAGEEGLIRLWKVATQEQIRRLDGHDGTVWSLDFSLDGRLLASGSGGRRPLRLWHVADGKESLRLKLPRRSIRGVALAPDGKSVAALSAAPVPEDHWLRASPLEMADQCHVWELAGGTERWQAQLGEKELRWYTSLAFSQDGQALALGGWRPQVEVRDVVSGKQLWQTKALSEIASWGNTAVTFPDSRTLLSVGKDSVIGEWEATSGKGRRRLEVKDSVSTVARVFSVDGRILATADHQRVVYFFEVQTGELLATFLSPHYVQAMAFSPDGKTLACGGGGDHAILLWDVAHLLTKAPFVLKKGTPILTSLWQDLAATEGVPAQRAVWTLVRMAPQAVPFFKDRLRPAAAVDARRLTKLVQDLDDPGFKIRAQATQELEKLRELAEPALRKVLSGTPSLEMRRRVERLLENLTPLSPERLRVVRAVQVLECIGDAPAHQLLDTLAQGCVDAWLTQEAHAALQRLRLRRERTEK